MRIVNFYDQTLVTRVGKSGSEIEKHLYFVCEFKPVLFLLGEEGNQLKLVISRDGKASALAGYDLRR